jgi:hypothetical protein
MKFSREEIVEILDKLFLYDSADRVVGLAGDDERLELGNGFVIEEVYEGAGCDDPPA